MNKTPETRIINIYKDTYDFYIGRAGKGKDGYFGNPHSIGWCSICKRTHDRKDCLTEFDNYFISRINSDVEFKNKVLELKGHTLGCFCKPQDCHGDIIKNWLDKQV